MCCGNQNMCMVDRLIRLIVGLGLLVLPIYWDSSWAVIGLIGLIPVSTALLGYCPFYKMMGWAPCGGGKCPICGKDPCVCKNGGSGDMKDMKGHGNCCQK